MNYWVLRILVAVIPLLVACRTTKPNIEPAASAHRSATEAKNSAAPRSVATSSDGVKIIYDRYGHGDIALIFVHGWSCDRTYWQNQVHAFSSSYQVAAIDLAGHGESGSGRKQFTIKAFAKDVEAVVASINAEKVILVGHSMGGGVIAEAARLLPGRVIGLVGIDTLQNVAYTMKEEQLEEMIRPFEEEFVPGVKAFVSKMLVDSTDPELADWIRNDMAAAPKEVAISALREHLGQYVTGEAAQAFQDIKAPVYCLNATLWPTSTESNRKHMTSFDVVLMENVGHFPMLEQPQKFNEELARIITRILNLP